MTLLGRLSVVGAPIRMTPSASLLRRSRQERTTPVVCRNLGLPCELEPGILARQLLARHQAEEILDRVEALPLKGLHLAHRVYPSPSLRDMGDLDLLVRPERLADADGALRTLGYRPDIDPARLAGGPLNAVEYWREGSLPVHLHWRVSNASLPHFMYRIDDAEIWREARDGAMAPHHLVVTLCEHALKHSYSHLLLLTDIELASRGLDWERAVATARRWGLERAVWYTLILQRDLLEVESPGLRQVRGAPLGWAGRAFLGIARRRRWDGLSALGLLSMTDEKARFVREALAPGPASSEGFASRTLGGRLRRVAGMVWEGIASEINRDGSVTRAKSTGMDP